MSNISVPLNFAATGAPGPLSVVTPQSQFQGAFQKSETTGNLHRYFPINKYFVTKLF